MGSLGAALLALMPLVALAEPPSEELSRIARGVAERNERASEVLVTALANQLRGADLSEAVIVAFSEELRSRLKKDHVTTIVARSIARRFSPEEAVQLDAFLSSSTGAKYEALGAAVPSMKYFHYNAMIEACLAVAPKLSEADERASLSKICGPLAAMVDDDGVGPLTFVAASNWVAAGSDAAKLVQHRHAVEELSQVQFLLVDGNGKELRRTQMSLRPTRSGLQFALHIGVDEQEGLEEAMLTVFGAGSIFYRPNFAKGPLEQASDLRLVRGSLFTLDRPFATESVRDGRVTETEACEPTQVIDASSLHPDLSGKAAIFACIGKTATPDVDPSRHDMVYLERYAQYLPYYNHDVEPGDECRFKIVAVLVSTRRSPAAREVPH